MATRKKSTLLAQGKERRPDGSGWPWRLRLYAPPSGGTSFQIKFKAPAGEGEPWRRYTTVGDLRTFIRMQRLASQPVLGKPKAV